MDHHHNQNKNTTTAGAAAKTRRRALLAANVLLLALGNCGGPLITRLYFLHGGHRVWLSSFLETAGFPVLLLPLSAAYLHRRRRTHIKPKLLLGAAAVGLLTGLDDYLYAYGVARLPISTSALIIASQLAFTAAFAFLLVKQKFTSYSVNAVVLLTIGAGVLAIDASGDRPGGETDAQYFVGFATTVAAAALYGFVLPLVEMTYGKAGQRVTYTVVVEFQVVMSFFASAFCAVGMFFNNDFKVIPREARDFGLGETKYYVVLALSAFFWQCFFLGAIGVVFCASSLLSGIVIAVLLPVTEILAVVFYREKFQAQKGVSLALSLWGFVSYFYGEIKHSKKMKVDREAELADQRDQINP